MIIIKSKKYNFAEQLKKGKAGELAFMELYNSKNGTKLIRTNGRIVDYNLGNSKVELKSDYYDDNIVKNFFMEIYSDINKKSPGGPWQALAKGADLFIYWFVESGNTWEFNPVELVPVLDEIVFTRKPTFKEVENNGFVTGGFCIDRKMLENQLKSKQINFKYYCLR
jgi:hypothetical protein